MSERLWGILISSFPRLLLYLVKVTIPLTVSIFAISVVLAFILAMVQVLNIRGLKQLTRIYVWIFRGTPLIVQMYIIFYGLPSLGIILPAFPSAVIAFSMNYAAYMSETIRASIMSVPEGQIEAGYMIGLTYGQIMRRIVIPQAARVAFPTMFGSLIGLTKDSSLAASITVVEMFKTAQQIASKYFEPFALYCEAALIYLMLNTLLTFLQAFLERKLAWKQPKDDAGDSGASDAGIPAVEGA
ncbi:MAG: amino acid ABC transporter permease [Lachnospiraceae bacterium]|nr:amino acid ABC transporter permease [Lachnospiraceae bacterium]